MKITLDLDGSQLMGYCGCAGKVQSHKFVSSICDPATEVKLREVGLSAKSASMIPHDKSDTNTMTGIKSIAVQSGLRFSNRAKHHAELEIGFPRWNFGGWTKTLIYPSPRDVNSIAKF
jgi:hypothetical protein